MSSIERALASVHSRIDAAARAAGRDPASVQLLAVSKTFPAEVVAEAVKCGQFAFGENYAQEGVAKIAAVRALIAPGSALTWHFIGPIQSNKTRLIAEHFDWVQTVDRLNVAQRLSQQRPAALGDLQICIQVNISGEASKHGVEPADLAPLAREVSGLARLKLRGLMAIPEPDMSPERSRAQLRAMRELQDDLARQGFALDTLSMGMSDDLEAAIAEGATLVRVGRAIFGDRARKLPAA